mmetsp:Transcript_12017/g.54534  ORF Transcript_12017/g.54534 Transcript_12017/m.54534 type:complete len:263 (+) Transcript_12017:1183-1971(+)
MDTHGRHDAGVRGLQRSLHRRTRLWGIRRVWAPRVVHLQNERPAPAQHPHVHVLPPRGVELTAVRPERPRHHGVDGRLHGTHTDRRARLAVHPRSLRRPPRPLLIPAPNVHGLVPRQHANRRADARPRRRHGDGRVKRRVLFKSVGARELFTRDALGEVVLAAVVLPHPSRGFRRHEHRALEVRRRRALASPLTTAVTTTTVRPSIVRVFPVRERSLGGRQLVLEEKSEPKIRRLVVSRVRVRVRLVLRSPRRCVSRECRYQ